MQKESPWIGGPGTWLPRPVESLLGWFLAIGCLTVSGYHYLVATFINPTVARLLCQPKKTGYGATKTLPCWLPLTTLSRSEMDRASPTQRHEQLFGFLKRITNKELWSDEELVRILRTHCVGRRLASLAMRPTNNTAEDSHIHASQLGQQLIKVWPALLALPSALHENAAYDISMIIPAYRERGMDVRKKLARALQSCQSPKKVQVVVLNAGGCDRLEEEVGCIKGWGNLRVVAFTSGGGRGPCFNFGAGEATGLIYTFCHSDTELPLDWDVKVRNALTKKHLNNGTTTRANSCAFSFGIDTSQAGLNGGPFPPGIRAVETTANLRTHLYSLPYGDQVISVPAVVFDYIGGFPDQCLMEDYELVSLLRRRCALLHKFGLAEKEGLIIIGGPPALCSPRRWQKFGVLHVTYMNSKFVNLYAGGLSPDDMFQLYYGSPPPERSSEVAPWEEEMKGIGACN